MSLKNLKKLYAPQNRLTPPLQEAHYLSKYAR